jgi:putative ABC transport system substrate-binding protein
MVNDIPHRIRIQRGSLIITPPGLRLITRRNVIMTSRTLAVSTVLLLAGGLLLCGCGGPPREPAASVAFVQYVDSAESEEVRLAALEGLARGGLAQGDGLDVHFYSAGTDFSLLQAIAAQAVGRGHDAIITFGTPATQAVFARIGPQDRLVFGLVSDPVSAGLCRWPGEHQPRITGYYGLFPTTEVLELIHAVLPEADVLGVVWNSGESNSHRYLEIIRTEAGRHGLRLEESAVAGTSEILSAAEGLASRGADVFFCAGDSTVIQGFEALASVSARRGIPVFANISSLTSRGAVMTLGRSFEAEGRAVGQLAAEIISRGRDPADTPFRRLEDLELRVNADLMDHYGLEVPQQFRPWQVDHTGDGTVTDD